MKNPDHVHTTVGEMLDEKVIKARGLDHPDPSVVVVRLCDLVVALLTECAQLRGAVYSMHDKAHPHAGE